MFKKTDDAQQISLFGSPSELMNARAKKKLSDPKAWHNVFRNHVLGHIDENLFISVFSSNMGAPNYSIKVLLGMMIIKEVLECSDKQLFEHCEFNLLTRSALGLVNIDDPLPAESTYYLFREKVHNHYHQTGDNLFERVFATVTQGQATEFNVSGKILRMDSAMIGSNIASYNRYELIHRATDLFYKSVPEKVLNKRMNRKDRSALQEILKEESGKVVYRSTKQELIDRMNQLGRLIYRLLRLHKSNPHHDLLQKILSEQYMKVDAGVVLLEREKIPADSIQSPDDPDCNYRNKGGKKVKGYSVNATETCSDDQLNLITDIQVDKVNTPDSTFLKKAIVSSKVVTQDLAKRVHCDGAYHSPDNATYAKLIQTDLVLTGMQGKPGRYDFQKTSEGLLVTNRETGEVTQAVEINTSKGLKWRIDTPTHRRYFTQKCIENYLIRQKLANRTKAELNLRNNVEATMYLISHSCRNRKSRYRKIIPNRTWAYTRGLAINMMRICKYIETTCQRTQAIACLSNVYVIFSHWRTLFYNYWAKREIFIPVYIENQNSTHLLNTPSRSGLSV